MSTKRDFFLNTKRRKNKNEELYPYVCAGVCVILSVVWPSLNKRRGALLHRFLKIYFFSVVGRIHLVGCWCMCLWPVDTHTKFNVDWPFPLLVLFFKRQQLGVSDRQKRSGSHNLCRRVFFFQPFDIFLSRVCIARIGERFYHIKRKHTHTCTNSFVFYSHRNRIKEENSKPLVIMLLNNNGPNEQPSGSSNVVFRRGHQKPEPERHINNNNGGNKKKGKSGSSTHTNTTAAVGGGGGTSSVRNSWSFTTELPIQHHVTAVPIKENIYVDPETLMNGNDVKAVARSRLRQRSVSNLNAAALAGTRARDHSSSNRHQNGTMSAKGVDYIRIHHPNRMALSVHQPQLTTEVTVLPVADHSIIQDRSEYGNPDGSSAHSTAERESGIVSNMSKSTDLIHPEVDLYQAINQNQANDYKIIQGYVTQQSETADSAGNNGNNNHRESPTSSHPVPSLARLGSGRSSATKGRPSPTTTTTMSSSSSSSTSGSTGKMTSAEVHRHSRKPAAAVVSTAAVPTSTGPNAVKTEWTFLPSPTAATEPQHREINSKPEVFFWFFFSFFTSSSLPSLFSLRISFYLFFFNSFLFPL